jgi:hypothetical protein
LLASKAVTICVALVFVNQILLGTVLHVGHVPDTTLS